MTSSETADLYNAWHLKLYNLAFLLLHDREYAQDAVQDTFIKVQRYGAMPAGNEAKKLLNRILRNTCIDTLRVIKKNRIETDEAICEAIDWELRASIVSELISKNLTPKDAQVMRLSFEGYAPREIAKILSKSVNTVINQKVHAMGVLTYAVKKYGR